MSGEIPAELGSLSNLRRLWNLHDNALSGEIPAELGSLSNLTSCYLWQRVERGDTGGAWAASQRLERGDTGGDG